MADARMTQVCPACGRTLTGHSSHRGGLVVAACPDGHRFRVMIVEALTDGALAYRLGAEITDDELPLQ